MTRSTIAARNGAIFDVLLELYDYDTAAISATTNGSAVAFVADKYLNYRAVIDSAAYTGFAAGTAQWTIAIAVATTSGGTYTTVQDIVLPGTAGRFEIGLSAQAAAQANSDPNFIRVTATKTGSPGNLSFGCFLTEAL